MKRTIVTLFSCAFLTGSALAQAVTITAGGTYSGYNINTPGDGIYIATTAAVTIENSTIVAGGRAITNDHNNTITTGVNVTIVNCALSSNASSNSGSNQLVYFWQPAVVYITQTNINGEVTTTGVEAVPGVLIAKAMADSTADIYVYQNQILDCSPAVQIAGFTNDPNIEIFFNQIWQSPYWSHTDQINIYESGGTSSSNLLIQENLVCQNPDAPVVPYSPYSSGIIADCGSNYPGSTNVNIYANTVLNGGQVGIAVSSNNTATSNNIMGIGYSSNESYGLGWGASSCSVGTATGNIVGWWDKAETKVLNFIPSSLSTTNTAKGKDFITLAKEKTWYSNWLTLMNGRQIGWGTNPGIIYPAAGDFP